MGITVKNPVTVKKGTVVETVWDIAQQVPLVALTEWGEWKYVGTLFPIGSASLPSLEEKFHARLTEGSPAISCRGKVLKYLRVEITFQNNHYAFRWYGDGWCDVKPGERAFLEERVRPVLEQAVRDHKAALAKEAIDLVETRMADSLRTVRSVLNDSEAKGKTTVAALRERYKA